MAASSPHPHAPVPSSKYGERVKRHPFLLAACFAFLAATVVGTVVWLTPDSSQHGPGDCAVESYEPRTIVPVDLSKATYGGRFPPQEPLKAEEGDPIETRDSDASLEMLEEGQRTLRYPMAAVGGCIVLIHHLFEEATGRGYEELLLWNPKEGGSGSAIPGTRRDQKERVDRRIEGATAGWIVMRMSPPPVSPGSGPAPAEEIVLHHQQTGEIRVVATPPRGARISRPSISEGLVVWVESSTDDSASRVQRIQIYDIAAERHSTLAEVSYQGQHFTFGSPAIGRGIVVWAETSGVAGQRNLFVAKLADQEVIRYDLEPNDFTDVKGVSSDDRYLMWRGRNVEHATDLETGQSRTYPHSGSATFSGMYVGFTGGESSSYGKSTSVGGFYDLRQAEARLLADKAGCLCLSLGVMGNWFVWLEAEPITPSPQVREPIPTGTLRFMRIE